MRPENIGAGTFIQFQSPNAVSQVEIGMAAGGQLTVKRGDGTVLGTGTKVLASGRWYYIQWRFIISDTVGVATLKVDGTTEIDLSSQDTKNDGASSTSDRLTFFAGNGGSFMAWDDVTINDTTDTDNVSYPDHLGIEALLPSAAGDNTGLSTTGGATTQRFYFQTPSFEAAPVSPNPGSLWDVNGLVTADRRGLLSPTVRGSTMADLEQSALGHAQGDDVLIAQFVSPPLAAQTIDGTFKMYMKARENTASDDMASQVVIRVVSLDGTTEQAVLYAGQSETTDPPTSEWTTTQTNRGFPRAGLLPATLSSYACADGDRLVVEVGYRGFSAPGAGINREIRVGDAAASDLPEDETTTTDLRPWIAFSDTISLSTKGNYDYVNENPPNDATDYVFDSVVNDYDLYNIPSTQWTTVAAVVLPLRAQKSDAGAANIAHMTKYDTDASGTADTENTGADVALSTSWAYHTKYYNRQPDATAWSVAKVNALQVGAKVR
jgi:hypothetical protein